MTLLIFNARYVRRRARDSPVFPARNERRDRFPLPISPRLTAAGSAGVTASATWVVHPRLLFDSSHGGGPQGLPRADIARLGTHACMHIAGFFRRGPWTPKTPGSQWHFLRLPPRRRLDRKADVKRSNCRNPPAISRSLAAYCYNDCAIL